MNRRDAHAADGVEDFSRVGQDELTVVGGVQRAGPRVEDLNHLRAGLDLRLQVFAHERTEHSHSRCQARGFEYIRALVRAKFFECPPSITYEASVNGAPPNPISGTPWGPSSSRRTSNRFEHMRQCLPRLEALEAIDIGFGPQRVFDRRSLATDEVERDAHRLERQQQVGEENGGSTSIRELAAG